MSTSTQFTSGIHSIDARVHEPVGRVRGAMVVAHPHPLHGGNMEHPVVVCAAERATARGLVALRFDFRGVGGSGGSVSDFVGHLDDWRAAVRHATERAEGGPVFGGGFSYGARSIAALLRPDRDRRPEVAGVLLLAPATRVPRSKRDFGALLLGRPLKDATLDAEILANLRTIPVATQVIVGEEDVVAPAGELRQSLAADAGYQVLPGLNHFFSRQRGAGPTAYDLLEPALDQAYRALLS